MSANAFEIPNDMSDLCRVCLQLPDESQYLDLTTVYDEEENLTYGECFTICTQIDLNAGEGVPHHLCKPCGIELQMSYDFHKKIEESKRVIEECQRQLKMEVLNDTDALSPTNEQFENPNLIENDKASTTTLHLIDTKYVISPNEIQNAETSEMLSETQEQTEQHLAEPSDANDELEEVEIMNVCSRAEADPKYQNPRDNTFSNVEMNERFDDHFEIEALDDEEERATTSSFNMLTGVNLMVEEILIVEEISQDATEKWLDTLTDTALKHMADDVSNRNIQTDNTDQEIENELPYSSLDENNPTKDEELSAVNMDSANDESTDPQEIGGSMTKKLKKFICEFCNKTFLSTNKLNWHKRIHDKNRKRFICPIAHCRRIYASKNSCALHYKQAHMDEGFLCHICEKLFSSKQTLEVHMRYHTKEFPFKCNICERKFAQKGHLTQHVQVKHQNLRYICPEPECGKVFQNSVSLRNHHYTHSSMPFKCSHCAKEFPQKNKLRDHLLHKHNILHSLQDLEQMRQFNITRTRHAFVKVQVRGTEDYKNKVEESL